MSELASKFVLVTGAGSGIGAAVSTRLQSAGARVYRADLAAPADEAASRAGTDPRSLVLDVREEDAWLAALEAILATDGRLDALINCVGVVAGSPLPDTTLTEWRRVLGTNLDGAFLATKHGIRAMRDTGGVIVHVGSASGIRPASGAAAYSTSKAALRMLVQAAAKECRAAGWSIRVNAVSPAGVKTPMWSTMPFFQDLVRTHGSEDAAYAAMTQAGGGQFIEPDAVAAVVCFLVSDEAQHITGVDLPIDDGYVL